MKIGVVNMGNIYDRITEDNIKKYGTDINRYGPVLLSNLYSDKTHFIYELLQNAEDACERAKKKGSTREFFVSTQLFPDRLEVRHNGIEFNENDVKGICGLVEGTKGEDSSQIGKFGIGFKSVYAYTKSPQVYSGEKSFCIKNYVQPFAIPKREDIVPEETLFVIPFNDDKILANVAFSAIGNRLKNLSKRTLLFLKNIEEIRWSIQESSGIYLRESKRLNGNARRIYLLSKVDGSEEDEEWLVFHRYLGSEQIKIEVGYLLSKDTKTGKDKIVSARNTELVVFFPTEKETHLKFLTQGPYRTTSARDNIPYTDARNKELIEKTATLVAESISKIKEMNLLDISFLNTMPLREEVFPEETMFRPIYNAVKEKLSGSETLLPSGDGKYVTSKKALLADGEPLRNLLSSKQLSSLFGKDNAKWLDKNITNKKTSELKNYLMGELKIPEIDPDKFARKITEEFMKEQNDDWVKQFYGFLLGPKVLWKKRGSSYWEKEGPLRSKSIIRLLDNSHTKPFDSSGNPLVYLPTKSESLFKTVKKTLLDDKNAKKFLEELGLKEPDKVAEIGEFVLPKYRQDKREVKDEENIKDIEKITQVLKDISGERKSDLIDKVKNLPILVAYQGAKKDLYWVKPTKIYLTEKYTGRKDIELYFEGNEEIYFLDERYIFIDVSILEELGCKTKVHVNYMEIDYDKNVTLANYHGWHKRGLNGFDPDCEIEDLEYALRNINLERAIIIWKILKEHYKKIYGTVESSSRQDYAFSEKEEKFSKMGKLLHSYSWLPGKDGQFHKPSDLLLSDLSDGFDKRGLEARYIAEKLKFKKDVEQELLDQLPDERKYLYEEIKCASEESFKKFLDFAKSMKEEATINKDASPSEIYGKFQNSLVKVGTGGRDDSDIKTWTGIHPDEEEGFRKEYGDDLLKRLKNPQISTKTKFSIHTEIVEANATDPREFLFEQYKGHCQVCNTVLDLGSNRRPHFETFRLFETRAKNWWTNNEFNVLCLCPNCHTLMKYGRDLKNILEVAKKVSNNEIAPEEVDERNGDFYVVKINVAGKERELFYSPRHMGTLAAFIEKTTEKGK